MPLAKNKLLEVLDFITAKDEPQLESLHSRQVVKVRGVFDDPNIVGVGIGEKVSQNRDTGMICVCFYVEKKLPLSKISAKNAIPPVVATAGGQSAYTDVKVVGRLVPQVAPLIQATPIESGFSVGLASQDEAGTLGSIVSKDSRRYILSNAHVLANNGRAKAGAKILFPGRFDGGKLPGSWVANLTAAAPLVKGGEFVNEVDAAIAEIRAEHLAGLSFALPGSKKPLRTILPRLGMTVTKRGRTSGLTSGKIIDVDFRTLIHYPGLGKVGFTKQVLCERYTAQGDSGALVFDKASGRIVGLHFSGSPQGSVFNPIASVIAALGIHFTAG